MDREPGFSIRQELLAAAETTLCVEGILCIGIIILAYAIFAQGIQ